MCNFIRSNYKFYIILTVVLVSFFFLIIKNFYPFIHTSESVYLTADANFLMNNLSWWPIPHLKLPTDYFAYPYEFSPLFLTWMLEHDYFSGLLSCLLGIGPWEQFYFLLSLILTSVISFHLLRIYGHYEEWRAIVFSILVTFCNYAAICKYPGHYTVGVCHWVVINILMDFLILRRYFNKETFSATFILLRVLFLVLALGLELGYVAGMAFSSFTFVIIWFFICEIVRTRSLRGLYLGIRERVVYVFKTYSLSKWNYVLTGAIIIFLLLYLPIVLQIFLHSISGSVSHSPLVKTVSYYRILLPIFPNFNPVTFYQYMTPWGVADTIYANCVGWFFLLFFFVGIFFSIKRMNILLPFVVLVFLIVFIYQLPILRFFPWFSHARFTERFSIGLVPLMCLPFLAIDKDVFVRKTFIFWSGLLFFLFVLELIVAYRDTFLWVKFFPVNKFSGNFYQMFEKLKKEPGEALFFFPFSVYGGDGRGFPQYGEDVAHQMQFAALSNKKMNCYYGGRLDPKNGELPLFFNSNWNLLLKENKNGDFTKGNMPLLKTFFSNTNFTAIVLFPVSKVNPELRSFLYREFGRPIYKHHYLNYDIEVILLPDSYRKKKNKKNLKDFHFLKRLKPTIEFGKDVELYELSGVNGPLPPEKWGIWTIGKRNLLKIDLPEEVLGSGIVANFKVHALLVSARKTQHVDIYMHNKKLGEWDFSQNDNSKKSLYIPHIKEQMLSLEFRLKNTESPEVLGISSDSRELGIGFVEVSFSTLQPKNKIIFAKDLSSYHLSGAHVEDWGIWTQGRKSVLRLRVPQIYRMRSFLTRFCVNALLISPMRPTQKVNIFLKGEKIGEWTFSLKDNLEIRELIITSQTSDFIDLEFQVEDIRSPKDLGLSEDMRNIGVGLVSLEFLPLKKQ